MVELVLIEVISLLGEIWFSGGIVAVFRDSLEVVGFIIVEIEGGFVFGCSFIKILRRFISFKFEYNIGNYSLICSLIVVV